ncbi:hypothetical protein [Legionella pneumophila]|uniref:hypothetical protein n=1 Tax=Legionella pneumophila TaxID=446 RepID=UPI0022B445DB|nr:hypothetical protein [Legionella pneumophila]MCZ4721561.1 hypothetical protein [Legionella pneumophila]MCZ4729234.1 hypothetical protein [Legionella pneumophila]WBA03206.1 hypothetical protein LpnA194_02099 [Legionella pneumophila]
MRFPRSTEEGGTGLGVCFRPVGVIDYEAKMANSAYRPHDTVLVQVFQSLSLVMDNDPCANSHLFTMPVA